MCLHIQIPKTDLPPLHVWEFPIFEQEALRFPPTPFLHAFSLPSMRSKVIMTFDNLRVFLSNRALIAASWPKSQCCRLGSRQDQFCHNRNYLRFCWRRVWLFSPVQLTYQICKGHSHRFLEQDFCGTGEESFSLLVCAYAWTVSRSPTRIAILKMRGILVRAVVSICAPC